MNDKLVIGVGNDHRGFDTKDCVLAYFASTEAKILHIGHFDRPPNVAADYPDFANEIARLLDLRRIQYGILICSTGIGMSMVANRHTMVRAALCRSWQDAKMAREHNDANVLCLGGNEKESAIRHILHSFFTTAFSGDERHRKRLGKFSEEPRGSAS